VVGHTVLFTPPRAAGTRSSSWGGEGAGKSLARSSGKARASSLEPHAGWVRCRSSLQVTRGNDDGESRGRGVLCSGTTVLGAVQGEPCSPSVLSRAMCYQRASARQDPPRPFISNPLHSDVTSTLPTLAGLHLMSHPTTRCFCGTICHPAKRHLSRGCKQGRISSRGVSPGWRVPASNADVWQQMRSAPLRRSRVSCPFSSVGIAVGLHLAVDPHQALRAILEALQCLEPGAASDVSPHLHFWLHAAGLGSSFILDKVFIIISFLKEQSGIGPGCPGQWGSPHPWRGSNTVGMWHLGTWFSRRGGVGVTVGPDDLRGLFQPS